MLSKCYWISGSIAAGKTTTVAEVVEKVRNMNIPCVGFKEICLRAKEGNRLGYDLVTELYGDFKTTPFGRLRDTINRLDPRLFEFNHSAMKETFEFFKSANYKREPTLLYFDEFGRMESKGKGLWPSVQYLVERFESEKIPYSVIFALRKQTFDALKTKMKKELTWTAGIGKHLKLPCKEATKEDFAADVIESLRV